MLTASSDRTNNWSDYGGMDVYVSQITGTQFHDYFYTDADVIVRILCFKCGQCVVNMLLLGSFQVVHHSIRHPL